MAIYTLIQPVVSFWYALCFECVKITVWTTSCAHSKSPVNVIFMTRFHTILSALDPKDKTAHNDKYRKAK